MTTTDLASQAHRVATGHDFLEDSDDLEDTSCDGCGLDGVENHYVPELCLTLCDECDSDTE